MAAGTNFVITICHVLLWSTVGGVNVTPLPHGLMERNVTMQVCTSMYHLIVTFGEQPVVDRQNISGILEDLSDLVRRENLPALNFAAVLLHHLATRYNRLTNQYGNSTGAVEPVLVRYEGRKPNRNKRGLINAVGKIRKELFGIATEDDVRKIEQIINENRKVITTISHNSNELVTIVNVTHMQMVENRKATNELLESVRYLQEWVNRWRANMDLHSSIVSKLLMLESLMRDLERANDKVIRVRKDLENGLLSEDLLPMDELKKLINSARIPDGAKFVSPLYWYYSKMKVKLLRIDSEFVYAVDLPLVSEERFVAKEFKSFPTPNLKRNVTIQVSLSSDGLFRSHSGQITKLPFDCVGDQPLVCPPTAVKRDDFSDKSCVSSLFSDSIENKGDNCPVQVSGDMSEHIYYHGVNMFVLITWGTEITEGCFHSKLMSLSPGAYLIEWSGKCSLCTRYHCVRGVIMTGSTLRLENTWQVMRIPKMQNFSDYEISADFPKELAIPTELTLNDLIIPEVPESPRILWTNDVTSIFVDVIIITTIIVCVIVLVKYFKICPCMLRSSGDRMSPDIEVAIPLNTLAETSNAQGGNVQPLSATEAAQILISNAKIN